MTITLRHSFTPEQRQLVRQAVLVGRLDGLEEGHEVYDLALQIAEEIPALLRRCGMADNSKNREMVVDLVMTRLESRTPKPSTSYRRFRTRR